VDYGVGGCVVDLVRDQAERGWDVTVVAPTTGRVAAACTDAGAAVVPWSAERVGAGVGRDVTTVRHAVRRAGADVVHLHSTKAGIVGRLVIRGRVPTMFQPHGWSFLAVGGTARRALVRWERLAGRWTDRVVCCSAGEQALARTAGVAAPTSVVPNAVDVDALSFAGAEDREAARRALGLRPGVPLAVSVGRLCPQKGQRALLAAWRHVRADVADAELVLVGDGPDLAELERLAGPGVAFAGQRDDVSPWLAAADVFVLASRYEGMSLAVLEAMARGCSVVVTDVEGMRDMVGSGDDAAGAVVPVGDDRAFACEVTSRLRSPRAEERRSARARVVANHSKRAWCDAIAELTTDVACTPRTDRARARRRRTA
jgi:glycosyltransferase involved in cell wall biosynthesis